MRKWIGAICVLLGVVCLLCSVGFVVYNRWESENAAKVTESLLEDVQIVIAVHNYNDNRMSRN